jgi:hypothetical protein
MKDLPDELLMVDTGTTSRIDALAVFAKFGVYEESEVVLLTFKRVD